MTNDRTTPVGAAPAAGNDHETTLSAQRAFVVHLTARDGHGPRGFSGRVEHLSSGQSLYFPSLGGLLAFFTSFIDTPRPRTPRSPTGRGRGTRASKSA